MRLARPNRMNGSTGRAPKPPIGFRSAAPSGLRRPLLRLPFMSARHDGWGECACTTCRIGQRKGCCHEGESTSHLRSEVDAIPARSSSCSGYECVREMSWRLLRSALRSRLRRGRASDATECRVCSAFRCSTSRQTGSAASLCRDHRAAASFLDAHGQPNSADPDQRAARVRQDVSRRDVGCVCLSAPNSMGHRRHG